MPSPAGEGSALSLLLGWVFLLSMIAFLRFGQDKSRAAAGNRRISENDLLMLALIGGTPGAYAGRRLFRHKTRKQPFSTRLHLIALVQLGLLTGWLVGGFAA